MDYLVSGSSKARTGAMGSQKEADVHGPGVEFYGLNDRARWGLAQAKSGAAMPAAVSLKYFRGCPEG